MASQNQNVYVKPRSKDRLRLSFPLQRDAFFVKCVILIHHYFGHNANFFVFENILK